MTLDDLMDKTAKGDAKAIRLLTDLMTTEQLPPDRMVEALRVLGKKPA